MFRAKLSRVAKLINGKSCDRKLSWRIARRVWSIHPFIILRFTSQDKRDREDVQMLAYRRILHLQQAGLLVMFLRRHRQLGF